MTAPPRPDLKPLIISAPFGNYIQPRWGGGATPTLGTFTAHRRPGRIWRIVRTVRYYPRLRAWVNRIGLRNPGMPWLVERVKAGKISVSDKIISVHGFHDDEWSALIDQAASIAPLAIELNISCPNVGELNWPADLFARAVATRVPIIVKLPPVNYHLAFDEALNAGVRAFHCCNTLPIPAGGLSGKPLQPVALQCVRDLRARAAEHADSLTLIGGGGITAPADIDRYADAGATHFAVGTKVFNPRYLFSDKGIRPLIVYAAQKSENRGPTPPTPPTLMP